MPPRVGLKGAAGSGKTDDASTRPTGARSKSLDRSQQGLSSWFRSVPSLRFSGKSVHQSVSEPLDLAGAEPTATRTRDMLHRPASRDRDHRVVTLRTRRKARALVSIVVAVTGGFAPARARVAVGHRGSPFVFRAL